MQQLNYTAIKAIVNVLKLRRAACILEKCSEHIEELEREQHKHEEKQQQQQQQQPLESYAIRKVITSASKNSEWEVNKDLLREIIVDAVQIVNCKLERSTDNMYHASDNTLTSSTALSPRANIGSVLEGRSLQELDLIAMSVTADFNRSDLTRSRWDGAYVAHSSFNLCEMSHSNLTHAQFQSCMFVGVRGNHINASHARFAHCTFRRAELLNWDVRGATFYKCTFTQCDLSNWTFDTTTTVIEPIDWHLSRRLHWLPFALTLHKDNRSYNRYKDRLYECNVVGVASNKTRSLPARDTIHKHFS